MTDFELMGLALEEAAKAAAQPLGQIVQGTAAPSSGGIPVAVADAQHVLGITGHHPQQGHDPHPEHSPRPARQNGRRHAHDVAGADGGRQRRGQRAEVADVAFALWVAR